MDCAMKVMHKKHRWLLSLLLLGSFWLLWQALLFYGNYGQTVAFTFRADGEQLQSVLTHAALQVPECQVGWVCPADAQEYGLESQCEVFFVGGDSGTVLPLQGYSGQMLPSEEKQQTNTALLSEAALRTIFPAVAQEMIYGMEITSDDASVSTSAIVFPISWQYSADDGQLPPVWIMSHMPEEATEIILAAISQETAQTGYSIAQKLESLDVRYQICNLWREARLAVCLAGMGIVLLALGWLALELPAGKLRYSIKVALGLVLLTGSCCMIAAVCGEALPDVLTTRSLAMGLRKGMQILSQGRKLLLPAVETLNRQGHLQTLWAVGSFSAWCWAWGVRTV